MLNSKIKNYKQFDTRWARLSYRILPACVRLNGCGATSLADIIYPIKKVTPKDTRKWLLAHGYVSAGQGTYWAGIPACMRAYGFENVKNHATMPQFFAELAKGNRAGIILFRAGTRGGRTFTMGGHFCAIAGYKVKNGLHYLYVCDPGPRNNNGWICYETQMKGLCLQVWTGKYPEKKTKKKVVKKAKPKKVTKKTESKAKPKKVRKKTTAERIMSKAAVIHKYMKKYGFKYSNSGNACSWTDAKKKKASNCATYVCYTLQRLKLIPDTGYFYCSQGKLKFRGKLKREDLDKVAKVSFPCKKPAKCDLKPGDICGYADPPHTQIYAGKDKKGNLLWYSYGPSDVKAKLPRKRGNYNNKIISVLIRFK